MKPHQKTFDRIREAVLPDFRDRVADYLVVYEDVLLDEAADPDQAYAIAQQLLGYLRAGHGGLGRAGPTRRAGMA